MDCGNTALKCSLGNSVTTFYHQQQDFDSQFKAFLKSATNIESVVLANVSDEVIVEHILNSLEGIKPYQLLTAKTEATYQQLKNGYITKSQLGVDRWLAMIASQAIAGDKVIIDVGSWIKADVVTANGEHRGGVIISHRQADENKLLERFAMSSKNCENNNVKLGRSTQQCICASYGVYGEQALIQWLSQLLEKPKTMILTGGGMKKLQKLSQFAKQQKSFIKHIHYQENLVLSGLSIRYSD